MRFLLLFSFLVTMALAGEVADAEASKVIKQQETTVDSDDNGFDEAFEEEFSDPEGDELFDPLSGYNTMMTDVNDKFYTYVLFPVSRGYSTVVPEGVRHGVSRCFENLRFPVRFVNNLLQFKITHAVEELARFGINSTLGILGFFDPAKGLLGLEAHDEDFGQTLGFYGAGGGFHIVLPILGPSNLRDSLGLVTDWYADPLVYWESRRYNLMGNYEQALAGVSFDAINEASFNAAAYESLKRDAVELYPFFRDVYRQNREKRIKE